MLPVFVQSSPSPPPSGGLLDTLFGWLDADKLINGAFNAVFSRGSSSSGAPGEVSIVMATLGAALVAWGIIRCGRDFNRGHEEGLSGLVKCLLVLAFIGFTVTPTAREFFPKMFDSAAVALGGSDPVSVAKKCGNLVEAFGASEAKLDAATLDAANQAKAPWYDLTGKAQGSVMRWVRVTIAKIIAGLLAVITFVAVGIGLAVVVIAKFAFQLGWLLMPLMLGFFALPSLAGVGMRFVQGQVALASVNFILAVLHLGTEALLKLIGTGISKTLSGGGIAALENIANSTMTSGDRVKVLAALTLAPTVSQFFTICLVLFFVVWLLGVSFFGFNVGRALFIGGTLGAEGIAKGAAGAMLAAAGSGFQILARRMASGAGGGGGAGEAVAGGAGVGTAESSSASAGSATEAGSAAAGGEGGSGSALGSPAGGKANRARAAINATSAALKAADRGASRSEQKAAARAAAIAEGLPADEAEKFAETAVEAASMGAGASGKAGGAASGSAGGSPSGSAGGGSAAPGGSAGGGSAGGGGGGSSGGFMPRGRGVATPRRSGLRAAVTAVAGAGLARAGSFLGSEDGGGALPSLGGIGEEGAALFAQASAQYAEQQALNVDREELVQQQAQVVLGQQQVELLRKLVAQQKA